MLYWNVLAKIWQLPSFLPPHETSEILSRYVIGLKKSYRTCHPSLLWNVHECAPNLFLGCQLRVNPVHRSGWQRTKQLWNQDSSILYLANIDGGRQRVLLHSQMMSTVDRDDVTYLLRKCYRHSNTNGTMIAYYGVSKRTYVACQNNNTRHEVLEKVSQSD